MGAIRKSSRRGLVRELVAALDGGRDAFLAFIERHSIPEPNTGCWLWIEGAGKKGYGWIVDPRRPIYRAAMPRVGVHRLVCEILYRPMGADEQARHLCHNPGCVNPSHLAPGSVSDNLMDSVRDGRWTFTRGTGNGRAKMTEANIAELREGFRRHCPGESSKWAMRFGVSESSIRQAVGGRTWQHVEGGF